MGGTTYSSSSRSTRAIASGYYSKSVNDTFAQNKVRRIHETMDPKNALIREARDSEAHPLSVPIVFALDVTGSMGKIPSYLVKDGLPHLMDSIIQGGVKDPQILFLGIGDWVYDSYPLQVGQFESGDEELDLWLTRTYLEGGGGGNEGESYSLAWYFAAKHTVTDAWEKRKQKGFIFTVGDEPCLRNLSESVVKEIMGTNSQSGFSDKELLVMAQEKYNVYHLHIMEGSAGHASLPYWKELLRDNCITVENHTEVSKIIAEIVVKNSHPSVKQQSTEQGPNVSTTTTTEEILL